MVEYKIYIEFAFFPGNAERYLNEMDKDRWIVTVVRFIFPCFMYYLLERKRIAGHISDTLPNKSLP